MAATGVFPCKVATTSTSVAELLDVVLIERVPNVKKADHMLNAALAYQRAVGVAVDAVNRALDAAEHELSSARAAWEAAVPRTTTASECRDQVTNVHDFRGPPDLWPPPQQEGKQPLLHEQLNGTLDMDKLYSLRDQQLQQLLKGMKGSTRDGIVPGVFSPIPTVYTRLEAAANREALTAGPSKPLPDVYSGAMAPLAAARSALNDARSAADAAFESSVAAGLHEAVRDAKLGALDAIVSSLV